MDSEGRIVAYRAAPVLDKQQGMRMKVLVPLVMVAVAAVLGIAGLSLAATLGVVMLVTGAAVLWMSFVYLLAQRLAPRRRDVESDHSPGPDRAAGS